MPKGPKGQKRPADVIGNAVRVMEIATGQREEECEPEPTKNQAAAELGRKGGKARSKSMSPEKRREIAQKAAALGGSGQIDSPDRKREIVGASRQSDHGQVNAAMTLCPFIRKLRQRNPHFGAARRGFLPVSLPRVHAGPCT